MIIFRVCFVSHRRFGGKKRKNIVLNIILPISAKNYFLRTQQHQRQQQQQQQQNKDTIFNISHLLKCRQFFCGEIFF